MGKKIAPPTPPFSVAYDQAEARIANAISEAAHADGVPFFLIEGILTKYLYQTKEAAKNERADFMKIYRQQMKEYEEAQKGETGK